MEAELFLVALATVCCLFSVYIISIHSCHYVVESDMK